MFGPQGHIEQWLNAYGDLIAQEGDAWQWRSFYDQPLSQDNQNLIALHQARIIRSVLWDHNDQPREFTYHAGVDSIDSPIDVVNWQIADQTQIIQRSRKTQDHYPVIPVKLAIDRNREILIKLTNDQGQKSESHFRGPWAFQHFIDHIKVSQPNTADNYILALKPNASFSQNFKFIPSNNFSIGYIKLNSLLAGWKVSNPLFNKEDKPNADQ